MSTYFRETKHPVTGEWEKATWHDDYFGEHHYGVQFPSDGSVYDAEKVELETRDSEAEKPKKYSLFIGRYQPFHKGHATIMEAVLAEGKNICIALRDTPISDTDPYTVFEREQMIRNYFPDRERVKIIEVPDIEEVCYGRKVGWGIREIKVDPEIEKISATEIRKNAGNVDLGK